MPEHQPSTEAGGCFHPQLHVNELLYMTKQALHTSVFMSAIGPAVL